MGKVCFILFILNPVFQQFPVSLMDILVYLLLKQLGLLPLPAWEYGEEKEDVVRDTATNSERLILNPTFMFSPYLQQVFAKKCLNETSSKREIELGGFLKETESTKPVNHMVWSGKAYLLNSKQVEIEGFNYGVPGPYAYWTAKIKREGAEENGKLKEYEDYRAPISVVMEDYRNSMNKKKRCKKPDIYKAEENEKVILTLPLNLKWSDIKWIGIYCHGYKHLFNYMMIPDNDEVKKLDDLGYCGNAGDCTLKFQECPEGSDIKDKDRNAAKICFVKCQDDSETNQCAENHENASKPKPLMDIQKFLFLPLNPKPSKI